MNFRDKRREDFITCPRCGREYHPAEIFIPRSFFGRPEDIDRTPSGKIDIYDGPAMDLTEEYICDACGCEFEITASLSFKEKEKNRKLPFEDIFSTPLEKKRLTLFEE